MTVDRFVRDSGHNGAPTAAGTGSPASSASSLAASVARVDAAQGRVHLTTEPDATGWIRCSELLTRPHTFASWWTSAAEWLAGTYGEAPRRTAIAYVMSWYLRIPAYVGAAMLFHERRVPSLHPEDLAVRLPSQGRPNPEAIAVLGDDIACLPLDPLRTEPQATVADDERALAGVLRARYTAHAARFVRAYRSIGPLGTRTLWAAATDALDDCLWWAGRDCGDEGAGVADATLVLESAFAPLTSPSTVHATDEGWQRDRQSCCFTYLLPGREECAGCPRRRRAG